MSIEIEVFLLIIAGIFLTCLMVIGTAFILAKYIIAPYKRVGVPMTPNEMYETISLMLAMEFEVYNNDVFMVQGNVLDSNTFENYYNTITYNILGNLTDEFFDRAKYIMSKDAIVGFIARSVRSFLSQKIATGGTKAPTQTENTL